MMELNKLNGLEKEERACDADGLYINIPQAEAGFFPPLFYRSETHQQGSQIGTILIREAYYAIYYFFFELCFFSPLQILLQQCAKLRILLMNRAFFLLRLVINLTLVINRFCKVVNCEKLII